ncbi:hypothetical protein HPB48_025356 [Haemaphysalis longicornis]|uniref:Isochorismatase-like domain-containing protein n=1 Tax=Haemaphysalis longicornis TaxID=44386 RepID=A0A9J6H7K6_HAELO|nr:hypothetical protein HPB48_025356 [Haemaphysalis longicornis]
MADGDTMAAQAAVRNVGRLSNQKTAIFLCDMQEKFRKTIQYFPQIVAVSQRLLKAGRALDMTVIVTEQYPKGLGPTVPELGLSEFPDIKPIEKTQFSMMTAEVTKLMQEKGLDSVVLCGIEAHVCVQNTALALLERGFNVHVAVDACSSRTMVRPVLWFRTDEGQRCVVDDEREHHPRPPGWIGTPKVQGGPEAHHGVGSRQRTSRIRPEAH